MKIVSDGTDYGTKVFDDDGKEMEGITSIEWSISVRNYARAKIEFIGVEVEVEVEDDNTLR